MQRVRTVLTGWSGGPGLMTQYFTSAGEGVGTVDACVTRVQAFITALKSGVPNVVRFQTNPDVDIVNPASGAITDTITSTASVAPIDGTGAGNSMPPEVAALFQLRTATFHSGRRSRGRTFLSPVILSLADATGQMTLGAQTAFEGAGSTLLDLGGGDPTLVVWHRPKLGVGGSADPVVSVTVPLKFAVLRSRRD